MLIKFWYFSGILYWAACFWVSVIEAWVPSRALIAATWNASQLLALAMGVLTDTTETLAKVGTTFLGVLMNWSSVEVFDFVSYK